MHGSIGTFTIWVNSVRHAYRPPLRPWRPLRLTNYRFRVNEKDAGSDHTECAEEGRA